jgi:hypothetical protein
MLKEETKDSKKKRSKEKGLGSFIDKQNNIKNNINTLTFLQESDISLSKPVMIKNFVSEISILIIK